MERIPKRAEVLPAAQPATAKRPERKARGEAVARDKFELAPSPSAKLTVKAPPAERIIDKPIPSLSEFSKGEPADSELLKRFAQETGLKGQFEGLKLAYSENPKTQAFIGELKRQWISLQTAQKAGNAEEMGALLEEIVPLMNRIKESLAKENTPSKENIERASPDLRLADRLTADEAAERITEFNQLFKSPEYSFKDLKGQTFSRAEDQQAVKNKMAGKGIGPFYLNDKGDKMLAPDRDAHGGGTFKYFKKVDNQWVRQQTLDHEGKPFRT